MGSIRERLSRLERIGLFLHVTLITDDPTLSITYHSNLIYISGGEKATRKEEGKRDSGGCKFITGY